jgi:hypothetical protein
MRLVAALSVALFLAVGASGGTVHSGLYGVVTRGPITPVCTVEQPCSEPAAGAVVVFSRNGNAVARVTVRTDGSYRVHLPPGLYAVRAGRRPVDPAAARVQRGRMRRVDFSIDTGIR